MNSATIVIGAAPLDWKLLAQVAGRPLQVSIAPAALERVDRGRKWVDELVTRGDAVYGINTGFGHLKNKRISNDELDRLQENLLISHAVGVGPPTPPEIVRWMLLFKIHMLCAGHSGVRREVVETLASWLNHDLLPVVPTRGSLGASGDLAPLAHLVLPLIGRGEMLAPLQASLEDTYCVISHAITIDSPPPILSGRFERAETQEWQRRFGLHSIQLAAKEGLALINGTQFMSAYAANIGVRVQQLADLADLIYCMTLEGLRGSVSPADERIQNVRPHPGSQTVAANIRRLMRESEILVSHANCDRVQDPYSLRCVPFVHGAYRDTLGHFRAVVEREINSVTDNPILFADPDGRVDAISGGNFHGAPLAAVLDFLAISLTDLANISERRIYLLLEGDEGLPKLLMRDTGVNSGFMIPQYTAAALVNECKVLATPASVDSIPSSLGQEDHVSMGATSAVKCYEVLDRVETVLAIEMLCAAQALDFRAPLKPGVGPRTAHQIVRKRIPHTEVDREFGRDIAEALDLLRTNNLLLHAAWK